MGWALLAALALLVSPFLALDAIALVWLPVNDLWFWALLASNWAVGGLSCGLACALDNGIERLGKKKSRL